MDHEKAYIFLKRFYQARRKVTWQIMGLRYQEEEPRERFT